ncbi:hypothetical protein TPHA_0A05340 [Tetrapisispora phaffii CBS 4417]|uniref:Protein SVP26 n=1 Tax=Tetrapisispora phaffii (strain ATCC 24235 / CBS 4417 / NBRC 1672 / NRRL Y-8282 / UCD 70-5) TaxID=1071381 RepID=G8BNY0_TETPH|nr:hypothetical protein TPHA_0A05340 [Tetrapisispora phaffii CBS 4417]CCE61608.1 hypothetical protein TPHA_0A05340 [Tetrapisispora phaffii CBS 4417]
MLLEVVSYAGTCLGFVFLTLAIASALYYISEIVEEHTEPTRRVLTRTIYGLIVLFVLLIIFDSFPIKLTLFAIVSHIIYYQNLKTFPFISLSSPAFLASCACVVINHYLWFKYFNDTAVPPQFRYDPNYIPKRRATFAEVSSFFGICVWFIPFALFVSLSASDYVLPTAGKADTSAFAKKHDSEGHTGVAGEPRLRGKAVGLARVVINSIRGYIAMCLNIFGFKTETNHHRLAV